MKMFRKLALGLIAAGSLGAAALAPTAASAHGFHGLRVRGVNVCAYSIY
jgi:hypothetical protein